MVYDIRRPVALILAATLFILQWGTTAWAEDGAGPAWDSATGIEKREDSGHPKDKRPDRVSKEEQDSGGPCSCVLLCGDGDDRVAQDCPVCLRDPALCEGIIVPPQIEMLRSDTPLSFLPYLSGVGLYRGSKIDNPQNPGDPVNADTVIGRSAQVCILYQFDAPEDKQLVAGQTYTFDFPEELSVPGKLTGKISDTDTAKVIADFVIAAQSHTVTITTVNDPALFATGVHGGYFWFSATLDGDKLGNLENKTLQFPLDSGLTMDFTIRPEGKQISASVKLEKKRVSTDLANRQLTWEVKLTPIISNARDVDRKIKGLVINDILSGDTHRYVAGSLKVTDRNGAAVNSVNISEDATGNPKITFPTSLAVQDEDFYTLTYKTGFGLDTLTGDGKATFENQAKAEFTYPQYDLEAWNSRGEAKNTGDKSGTAQSAEISAQVAANFLEKKGEVAAGAVRQIDWEVNINESGLGIENAKITDTLDSGMTYIEDSVKLYDSGNQLVPDKTPVFSPGKNSLSIGLGDISGKYTLRYSTEVGESYWQKPANFPFQNNVSFTGGPEPGISIGKTARVNPSGSMLSKSGSYDPSDHSYTWTIKILSNQNVNSGPFTLTDILPDGLLPPGLDDVTVPDGWEKKIDDNRLTVSGNPIATGAVTFKTFLADSKRDSHWGNNYSGPNTPFGNSVSLQNGGATYTVNASPSFSSKVIAKESTGYNASTKTASWKITVNQNKMAVKNFAVTDEILTDPQAWAFGNVKATQNGADITDRCTVQTSPTLKVDLPDQAKGDMPVVITYDTVLQKPSLLDKNGDYLLKNEAAVTGDSIKTGGVSVTAQKDIQHSMVSKTGAMVGNDGSIRWKVIVNANLLTLESPKLTDTLNEHLALDAGSFKLYRLGVSNGKVVETGGTEVTVTPKHLSYDPSAHCFTFTIPGTVTDAYRLEFTTAVGDFGILNPTVSNSISLDGRSQIQSPAAEVVAQGVGASGGAAFANRGTIKIKKTDGASPAKPLGGAYFLVDDMLTVGPTGPDGTVTTPKLKTGNHTLRELTAPEGYVPDSTPKNVTVVKDRTTEVSFTNKRIRGEFVWKASSAVGDQPIEGVTVGVFSGDGTKVAEASTGPDGTVRFPDLPYGSYTARIVEGGQPDAYEPNNKEITFTIDTDGQEADKSADPLVLEPRRTAVAVLKRDRDGGAPLPGARIALFDQSGNKLEEMTTGADGRALFEGLLPGNYFYQELAAPEGYLLDSGRYAIAAALDRAAQGTLPNEKITGDVQLRVTGPDGKAPIQNALVGVFTEAGEPVAQARTGPNGTVSFRRMPWGRYYLRLLETPEGYHVNGETIPFQIEEQGAVVDKTPEPIELAPVLTVIEVLKKDAQGGAPLSNAVIALLDQHGVRLAEKTTGGDGKAVFEGLLPGTYFYQELEAPAGYLLDDGISAPVVIDSGNRGRTLSFDLSNERAPRSGGGGGDTPRDDGFDFWREVQDRVERASPGDTVKVDAKTYDRMPRSVMEALLASGVTMQITWSGGETVLIPAGQALTPEGNRVFYPLAYLEGRYRDAQASSSPAKPGVNPTTGGVWEISAPAAAAPAAGRMAPTPADAGLGDGAQQPDRDAPASAQTGRGTAAALLLAIAGVIGFCMFRRAAAARRGR